MNLMTGTSLLELTQEEMGCMREELAHSQNPQEASEEAPSDLKEATYICILLHPVSYTHLTLPTIYSV